MIVFNPSKISAIISLLLSFFELLGRITKLGNKIKSGYSSEGQYTFTDYVETIEILDAKGRRAVYKKEFTVEYKQNQITSITDFGWTDGEGLQDYQISPGTLVDQYKSGHREYLLISLKGPRNRGDQDKFHVKWKIKDGFLKNDGYW